MNTHRSPKRYVVAADILQPDGSMVRGALIGPRRMSRYQARKLLGRTSTPAYIEVRRDYARVQP
jgi:hypothetical protein